MRQGRHGKELLSLLHLCSIYKEGEHSNLSGLIPHTHTKQKTNSNPGSSGLICQKQQLNYFSAHKSNSSVKRNNFKSSGHTLCADVNLLEAYNDPFSTAIHNESTDQYGVTRNSRSFTSFSFSLS